jgi:hypothetical protein
MEVGAGASSNGSGWGAARSRLRLGRVRPSTSFILKLYHM